VVILILAQRTDWTALGVAELLSRRLGPDGVRWCAAEEIGALRWAHWLSADGVRSELRRWPSAAAPELAPRLIFNRLRCVELPQFAGACAADRDYARMELFALLLSWLSDPGCPVVNRPSPAGLAGAQRRPLVWHQLAARAGLEPLALAATSSTRRFAPQRGWHARPELSWQTALRPDLRLDGFSWFSEAAADEICPVLVVGDRVFGEVAPALAPACRRLAALSGADVLGLDFVRCAQASSGYAFAGADPCPAVSAAVELEAIADLLEARGRSGLPLAAG
jgi:hypothetical protein